MGKNKGPGYERKFCKSLSRWWTAGRRDDVFWRTAGSGARATVRFKKGRRTADSYGDVMATHKIGKQLTDHSVFSLKRGYTGKKQSQKLRWVNFLDVIDLPDNLKTEPALIKWWNELEQLRKDSFREHGFLVFKRDRKKEVICMAPSTFNYLEKVMRSYYAGPTALLSTAKLCIIAMPLEDFFEWCKPAALGRSKRSIKRR